MIFAKKHSPTVDKSPYIAYLLIERSLRLMTGRRTHVEISHIPYDVAVHATPMEDTKEKTSKETFFCVQKMRQDRNYESNYRYALSHPSGAG